jgi:hypothetical protein
MKTVRRFLYPSRTVVEKRGKNTGKGWERK